MVTKVAEAGVLVAHAEEGEKSEGDERKLCGPLRERFHFRLHQSPAPTAGTGSTRAGTVARTGVAFGTRQVMVPKTMMTRPIQIQGTIGFRCALMMGRPVSSLRP